jgi:hypothetical protein
VQKSFTFSILIFYCLLCSPVGSEEVRQLSWEDLVPADLSPADLLSDLTQQQQNLVYWLSNVGETWLNDGQEVDDGLIEEVKKAIKELNDSGVDVNLIVKKMKDMRTAIVKELNGQSVRIPGYLLPLEMSGAKATEFLLVPYVGACIHVPPPPRNQIVYVQTPPQKGYTSKNLFEPVWVTGVISAQSMVKDLFLVDGTADIDIGYSMQATQVEPYKD